MKQCFTIVTSLAAAVKHFGSPRGRNGYFGFGVRETLQLTCCKVGSQVCGARESRARAPIPRILSVAGAARRGLFELRAELQMDLPLLGLLLQLALDLIDAREQLIRLWKVPLRRELIDDVRQQLG